MQRQTIILGAVFAGLLVLILAIELVPDKEVPRNATLSAIDWYDIDHVVVSKGSKSYTLGRQLKSGENPARAEWEIKKPFAWKAIRHKVLPMIKVFDVDRPSLRAFKPGRDKKRYGFSANNAIHVTIKSGGKTRSRFIIGNIKSTGETVDPRSRRATKSYETYVMFDKDEYVYQVAGDLRKPFKVELNALRNKRLFDFKSSAIESITVSLSAKERVALTGTLEPATDKKKVPKRTWSFKDLPGKNIDQQTARAFASRIAALSASSFKGTADNKSSYGIDDKSPSVVITVAGDGKNGESKTLQITLGKVKKAVVKVKKKKSKIKAPAFDYYATVSGINEVFQISQSSYENLAKSHHHFLDRALFASLKAENVTNLEIKVGPELLALARSKDGWRISSPKGYQPDTAEVKKLLKSLLALKAVEFDATVTIEEAGFDTPALQIKVIDAKGTSRTLEVGKPTTKNKSRLYARLVSSDGEATPFVLYKSTINKFKRTPLDLQSKVVLAFDDKTLSSVVLSWNHANKREALTLKRSVNGKTASWTILKPAPASAGDSAKIAQLVKRLRQLRANKFYPKKLPSSVGLTAAHALAKVVVTASGKTTTLLISKKTDGSYYYAIGGRPRGVFSISKYVVKTLLKSKAELKGKAVIMPTPKPKTPEKKPVTPKTPAPKK